MLTGKKILITGVASERSIAWAIAEVMHAAGAELAFAYQGEKLRSRVEKIAALTKSEILIDMDVADDNSISAAFDQLKKTWGSIDSVVHSIGFAPREALAGPYSEGATRENYRIAHDISAYSFTALAAAAKPMMNERGSFLTLSYLGAERVVAGYNVMGPAKASLEASMRYLAAEFGESGIRVNAISAGPIKTLAAAGIKGFRQMLGAVAEQAPMKRNVTATEVANAAAFLCSDLASGVTGEVLHVDCGQHIVGLNLT